MIVCTCAMVRIVDRLLTYLCSQLHSLRPWERVWEGASSAGRREREARRLRLHSNRDWRVQILLRQHNVHLLRQDCRFRDLRRTSPQDGYRDTLAYTWQVENEPRANLPQKAGASTEQLSGVEETILKLSGQVSTLIRQQKYFRTRENRNFSTVRSTEKRIFNLNIIEGGLMVAMAGLQVFIVKMFFTGGRKGRSQSWLQLHNHLLTCYQAMYDPQPRWSLYFHNNRPQNHMYTFYHASQSRSCRSHMPILTPPSCPRR